MKPDHSPDGPIERPAEAPPGSLTEDGKVAARRRFLRGAGGGALVLTVPHRRANAKKKNPVFSAACPSLQGVPDLATKRITQKDQLQASSMGTPKGLICRPRPPAVDPNPLGNCIPQGQSKYTDANGQKFAFVSPSQLEKGCGSISPDAPYPTNTIAASYNYRLYQEGYCPIVWQNGNLVYDLNAKYYEKGKAKSCETKTKK